MPGKEPKSLGYYDALARWSHVRGKTFLLTAAAGAGLALSACDTRIPDSDGPPAQDEVDAKAEADEAQAEPAPPPISQQEQAARDDLTATLSRLGSDFGGSMGIAVVDVSNDWDTGFAEDKLLPQQSVSKLWVTITALDAVDRGELELDQPLLLRREDLTVFHQPIRSRVLREGAVSTTPLDLMMRAITESDNTANDRLLNEVGGPEAVRSMLRRKKLADIRFGPGERLMQSAIAGLEWRQEYANTRSGFFDARDDVPSEVRQRAFESYLANPVDGATPKGIATALARLALGELLSERSTARLISILQQTKSGPRRLKGGAPSGYAVAHKTGTGQFWDGRQSGYNDVALLTTPDGRTYAIAVMIGETRRSYAERFDMMQGVTRAVVEYSEALMAEPEAEETPDA